MGCSLHVFSEPPWVGDSASRPVAWTRSVTWTGVDGGRSHPLWCRTHLGDGPGTAAPGVQHDCILVPFLQHFILKSKTRSAGRKHSRATRLLNSSPCLHILGFTVWSLDQQHQHCLVGFLIRNAESQALPWVFGIWICISIKSPGNSHSPVHNKFEKHWPKLSSSVTPGLYQPDTLFKDRQLPQKGGADPLVPTAKAVPDSKKTSKQPKSMHSR